MPIASMSDCVSAAACMVMVSFGDIGDLMGSWITLVGIWMVLVVPMRQCLV